MLRNVGTHHFLVRGETDGHPAVCVCTHLVLHIRPDAAVTQEVVARLCVTPWFPISVHEWDENKHSSTITLPVKAPEVLSRGHGCIKLD